MNLLRGDFFKKKSKEEKPNLSHYSSALKKIAPLSTELLGEERITQLVPLYLAEIVINPHDVDETIFYFPLFLKKVSRTDKRFTIDEFLVELMDYEFVCYQALSESVEVNEHPYNEAATHIYLNPFTHALRLEYDIHAFAKSQNLMQPVIKKKNLLLITKDFKSGQLIFFNASLAHAAIIDELHDGKTLKKDCLNNLQHQLPSIPSRDWIVALQELKSKQIVFEAN